MLTLNIGGTFFSTTTDTLSPCSALKDLVYEKKHAIGDIFLDRDPLVFGKMLKLLRGYPSMASQVDVDVLYELLYWNHSLVDIEVPNWLKAQALTVHTLDPAQSDIFSLTHGLMLLSSVAKLGKLGHLPHINYTKCNVVGASTDWVDCVWVPLKEIELATVRYQFQTYFDKPRLFGQNN